MNIPPEDQAEDVLSKALRGYGMGRDRLPDPQRQPEAYTSFVREQLHLNPIALEGLDHYHPSIKLPPSIRQHPFPFYGGVVNIWSLSLQNGFLLVDTGCREEEALCVAHELAKGYSGIHHPLLGILLTHEHFDHAGGLSAFSQVPVFTKKSQVPALDALTCASKLPVSTEPAMESGVEAEDVLVSSTLSDKMPDLHWQIIPVPGHTEDSVLFFTYLEGKPILFTGDALFAGSAGRVDHPSHHARMIAGVKAALLTLPEDTLIFPGHGPASRLSDEWRHNPFLA